MGDTSMMSMRMEMIQICEIDVVGGATLSIFPEAENWLLSEGDHQNALGYVDSRKNMERTLQIHDRFLVLRNFS